MSDQLLIRDVPKHVRSWIDAERGHRMMTLKEFVIHTLERACDGQPPGLFDAIASRPQPIPESIPFTFGDLFAGIGELRVALQRCGGRR